MLRRPVAPVACLAELSLLRNTCYCRYVRGNLEARGSLHFAGDVQGRQVTLDDGAAETVVDEVVDTAEDGLAGAVSQAPVTGVGVQHAQVAFGAVRFVPLAVAGRYPVEQACAFDLWGPAGQLLRPNRK